MHEATRDGENEKKLRRDACADESRNRKDHGQEGGVDCARTEALEHKQASSLHDIAIENWTRYGTNDNRRCESAQGTKENGRMFGDGAIHAIYSTQ